MTVVEALLARAAAGDVAPRPPRSAARKLFVVGCARSGTTWVLELLGEHPATIRGTETHLYPDILRPLEKEGRPAAWTTIVETDERHRARRARGHVQAWLERTELHDLLVRAMAATAVSDEEVAEDLIAEIYDHVLATRGATAEHVFVDKTPEHIRYAKRILRRFPEAKVVEVLRDGRDVCVSMEKLQQDWVPRDRATQIARWVQAARLGLELRTDPAVADRVHLVRYEALRADPGRELTALFAFAGLDHDPALVAAAVDARDFAKRANTGDGRFYRKGVVGDWRSTFSAEDEALFREKVGNLFTRVGYRY